ncbi:HNH endonuclease [Streptomyces sp. NPDC056291]|uniref:HNH endonuclease n=1 Tax=Streptomyces sp. NPDC056291 TaxID=3345772 RepID=UPI0035D92E97
MSETWREVPEWPGYSVSDLGRVRGPRGFVLAPTLGRRGYRVVSMYRQAAGGRRRRVVGVHRLVLLAFSGPSEGLDAAHLSGNTEDNRLVNLKWATRKENLSHQVAHGTRRRGEQAPGAKLTADAVREIRRQAADGAAHADIAARFDVTESNVSHIVRRKSWRHVS